MYSQIGQKTELNWYGLVLSGFLRSQDRFRLDRLLRAVVHIFYIKYLIYNIYFPSVTRNGSGRGGQEVATPPSLEKQVRGVEVGGKPPRLMF